MKDSKPVYISISCNLPAIPHPTFSRDPVPFFLSPRSSISTAPVFRINRWSGNLLSLDMSSLLCSVNDLVSLSSPG
ncbi:hypothetical protein C4D60_Mb01t31680 [Musa balbisiana]|uniref:Uncharacterized protein n=1 Tax=Musa balbisiana TaxID=52838 RepID=A0A4S8JS67_MUSBA|nr:hypothetical protein C4D60_Mb01t31680 [Musa balbisiana]